MTPLRAALISALVVLLSGAISVSLARLAEAGPEPPVAASRAETARAGEEPLQIAGSGANILLMKRMTDSLPGLRVHDSIGSGGGVRALRDGAIDVAMVSRPLRDHEREGMRVVPYARTALVWVTNADVRQASPRQLTRWYRGEGELRPLVRELGDSGVATVGRSVPELAQAHDDAVRARQAELLLTDDSMRAALASIPGSFGLTDLGQLTIEPIDVHPIAIDGVEPTLENVRSGRYPFVRELALVVREDDGRANAFADLVESAPMRETIASNGYLAP